MSVKAHFEDRTSHIPPPVILSRREESPGEAARASREETRFEMTLALANKLALRAGMLRSGSA